MKINVILNGNGEQILVVKKVSRRIKALLAPFTPKISGESYNGYQYDVFEYRYVVTDESVIAEIKEIVNQNEVIKRSKAVKVVDEQLKFINKQAKKVMKIVKCEYDDAREFVEKLKVEKIN